MEVENFESTGTSERSWRTSWAALTILALLIGGYCAWLNIELYQHKQPFFDSLSYYESMFYYMHMAQNESLSEAVYQACFGTNTVCLPYLVGIAASFFVEPSRLIGVGIQSFELVFFLTAWHTYLRRVLRLKPSVAFWVGVGFLSTACLYYDNGGLSDFRMDLSLMLLFSASCAWYLVASKTMMRRHFLLFGVSMAMTCLFRATAPVFLVAACVPLIVLDFIRSPQQRKFLGYVFISTAVTILLAGWFYIANFEYLKYYYLVWNTDANAGLSLTESLQHLTMAKRGMGEPQIVMMVILAFSCAVCRFRIRQWQNAVPGIAEWDWRCLWVCCCCLGILVFKGAGLNPFVCLVALPAFVYFLIAPLLKSINELGRTRDWRWARAVLLLALAAACLRGWKNHHDSDLNTMDAHHQIIDAIVEDAEQRGYQKVTFGTTHLTSLDTNSLFATLQFDRPDVQPTHQYGQFEKVALFPKRVFLIASQSDWNQIPGESVASKVSELHEMAKNEIQYLIVPTESTLDEVARQTSGKEINRYCREIYTSISLDPTWQKIKGPIKTDVAETINIFHRNRGYRTAQKETE